jgi:hypothetical protein
VVVVDPEDLDVFARSNRVQRAVFADLARRSRTSGDDGAIVEGALGSAEEHSLVLAECVGAHRFPDGA